MSLYKVTGIVNQRNLTEKTFKDFNKANSYLEMILTANNLTVEETISKESTDEFVCNNYNRFSISRVVIA